MTRLADYHLFPCVPVYHDHLSTCWYTPDKKFQILRDNTVEPRRYSVCKLVADTWQRITQEDQAQLPVIKWTELLRGNENDVQAALGVVLYPPGSVPSAEPHNCNSGIYERWADTILWQIDPGHSMEPLPVMTPDEEDNRAMHAELLDLHAQLDEEECTGRAEEIVRRHIELLRRRMADNAWSPGMTHPDTMRRRS